jgi:hypothetical protein
MCGRVMSFYNWRSGRGHGDRSRYTRQMAESKTKPTGVTAGEFIARVPDPVRRADAEALVQIFQRATGEPPIMWGPSIVGFGKYHYKYESGREGDMCLVGFSPRSAALVLYARSGAKGEEARLAALGKYKGDKGCLYVKRLADIDVKTLEELVRASANHTRERSQCDVCVTNRAEKAAKRAATPKRAAKKTIPKPRAVNTKRRSSNP